MIKEDRFKEILVDSGLAMTAFFLHSPVGDGLDPPYTILQIKTKFINK